MPFIPHTDADIQNMLDTIGVSSVEQLFDEIPSTLKKADLSNVPAGLNEMDIARLMQERAPLYRPGACFIGAGAYEHYIPAAVWQIASRGEYYTAYTPYQAEASQGSLQLIYEYQTMMAELMAMEVSNASLYDGATALSEAVLMAMRIKRGKAKKVLLPKTVNPRYRRVLKTILQQQDIEIIELNYQRETGTTDLTALPAFENAEIAALIIPQPNFFGCLEKVDELTDWAKKQNILSIAVVNPTAMALLKAPGEWGECGADIVCGEGQPLGVPLSSGGPYFGFMCTKKEFVRQLPGRLVGKTEDETGQVGYTLTLQAREQHIRRAKATSNICTNQGLVVVAATIYMSLLGFDGLREVALKSHDNTKALLNLLNEKGVKQLFNAPFFHEFVIPADHLMASSDIQAGWDLSEDYPELGKARLVCVTETKTAEDIKAFANLVSKEVVVS